MITNAYYAINVISSKMLNAFPDNGARNACWRFLAKPLKIEFESIPNDNTRNVLGIS